MRNSTTPPANNINNSIHGTVASQSKFFGHAQGLYSGKPGFE